MPGKSKIKILFVDDEAVSRETISELLSLGGNYTVTTTNSGSKALEILKTDSFDIIVSDLLMPEMDGIALTKQIISMGLGIPIIVTTGFGTIQRAIESMQAGASDFITKPFNFDQIKITIEKALETKRLQNEREFFKKLSNSDELTDLGNFRLFQRVLQREYARAKRYQRPLSLMMIDIDDFKACNDTYGHPTGDIVLKHIAALIQKNIRGCDLAARYGGEEFAVILPETTEEEIMVVAERIRESIAAANFLAPQGQTISNLSVTIGLSSYPDKADDKKELIRTADDALYQGKSAGKNRVIIYRK